MGKKRSVKETKEIADICLILEGTFPYVKGGVSDWVFNLIEAQNHLKFSILTIIPFDKKAKFLYDIPKNVVDITSIHLQKFPAEKKRASKKRAQEIFLTIEKVILNANSPNYDRKTFTDLLEVLRDNKDFMGKDLLLNSKYSWDTLIRIYNKLMPDGNFLNFFWSYRNLLGSLYSVLLCDLPKAKLYHAVCTGYAGILMARSKIEYNKPCLITEHGIYTNERRIEITSANWLKDDKSINLNLKKDLTSKDLKDFWTDSFASYSRIAYDVADRIITLYEDNQSLQIADGAQEDKLSIIPNGIDIEKFSSIKKKLSVFDKNNKGNLKIALIGRVVPIKDVKTYIRVCKILTNSFPKLTAYILGPIDEDVQYYENCVEAVKYNNLEDNVKFCGNVNLPDYFQEIDVVVLTSISEAQPLVLLEAGAAGIPVIATNVGACKEIIYGSKDEVPNLGKGGEVCQISDSTSIANSIIKLVSNRSEYENASKVIKNRVCEFYDKKVLDKKYHDLYNNFIN